MRMLVDRRHAGHDVEVASAGEVQRDLREVVQVGAKPALAATGALGDDAHLSALRRVYDENAIGFTQIARLQDNGIGAVESLTQVMTHGSFRFCG